MSVIRLMIADNDPGQVQAVRAALDNKKDAIDIISTVSTREAVMKQLTTGPDIMLLNPEILKEYALSRFIHAIQTKSPRTKIIHLLKKSSSDKNMIADIRAGVRGFLKSTDSPAIMIKALRAVFDGEIWAERRILEMAISRPMLLLETLQSHVTGFPPLTNREMDMLTQVLQGASNKEIAVRSSISERTVKTHLYRVYRKLNVKSRTKAIALLSQA